MTNEQDTQADPPTAVADTWSQRLSTLLSAGPILQAAVLVAGPKTMVRGPAILAAGGGAVALVSGSRDAPPADDADSLVVWLIDLLEPPAIKTRRSSAAELKLRTTKGDVVIRGAIDALTKAVNALSAPRLDARVAASTGPLAPRRDIATPVGYERTGEQTLRPISREVPQ